MLTKLSFAVQGGPEQIRREDDKRKVNFDSEGFRLLKNG